MLRIPSLLLMALLAAGTASAQKPVCALPQEKPMTVAELFFGRDIHGRSPVSDAQWSRFVARTVATQFPDGFTVHDGDGEWRDPVSHRVVRERAKILTVAASGDIARRLQTII